MYQLTVLLGLLASVTTGVVGFAVPSKTQDGMLYGKRANPNDILGFDCTRIPEVCTNMCYGAFCLTNGESLTYDAPTPQTSKARRTAAGCLPQANRCSTKKGAMPGLNCDEYPFASTALTGGGTATRVNRCVPSGQNSIQGGTISAFYQNKAYCNGGPCSFNVGFENSGNVMYCDSYSGGGGSCTPDGNEIIGPNNPPAKRSLPDTPMTYKLASGGTIVVPSGAVPGQRVWQLRAHNETLWNEYTQSHVLDEEAGLEQYEYMLANLFFAETTILGYSDSDSEADKVPSE